MTPQRRDTKASKARRTRGWLVAATATLLTLAAFALLPSGAAQDEENGRVVWQGNGSENVGECEEGYHWVFTTGGRVLENVSLHAEMNGTPLDPIAMEQGGNSEGTPAAWHAETGIIDTVEDETPYVTFDVVEGGRGRMVLTISDCTDEEPEPTPTPTPTETPTETPTPTPTPTETLPPPPPDCPPTNLQGVANEDGSILVTWDAVDADNLSLYRAEGGGDLVLIGTFGPEAGGYLDNETTAGTTYTYELRPVVEGFEFQDCEQIRVTAIPVFSSLLAFALAAGAGVLGYVGLRRRRS